MNDLENTLSQVTNFQFIHEHLFTSGQPTELELQAIKEYGITSIVNLDLDDANPHLANEDRICLEFGLNYVHMPILWDTPSDDQCLLILDLIHYLVQNQMVWVHCANNQRTSSLMYLYRQYFMDVDLPTAQDLFHQIWEPNETWTGLIHAVALQLQGRKATEDLQRSLLMNPDHFA